MAWTDAIGDIFNRYSGAAGGAASAPADPYQDYCKSRKRPPQVMADALAHTFRSDQTPSFPEMVSSLFRQSNLDQRVGLLNHLVGAISPATLSSVPGLNELAGSSREGQSVSSQQAGQIFCGAGATGRRSCSAVTTPPL
jgi:hypothetical protein